MTDAGSLRVGHEEREQVELALRQQYAEGRLRPDELQERMTLARSAMRFADLDRLVADLPIRPPSAELTRPARAAGPESDGVGADPQHPLTISAGVSSHVRRGVWTVPAYLRVSAGMATVKVDFQQAICSHPIVDVVVSAGIGTVVLVLPEGWAANTDRVGKSLGAVSTQVNEVPEPGKPLLVLHGTSAAGTVRVRYPSWGDRRALRKAQRRGRAPATGRGPVTRVPGPPPVLRDWSAGPQDAPPRPPDGPAARR